MNRYDKMVGNVCHKQPLLILKQTIMKVRHVRSNSEVFPFLGPVSACPDLHLAFFMACQVKELCCCCWCFCSNSPSAIEDCCNWLRRRLEELNDEQFRELQHHQEQVSHSLHL